MYACASVIVLHVLGAMRVNSSVERERGRHECRGFQKRCAVQTTRSTNRLGACAAHVMCMFALQASAAASLMLHRSLNTLCVTLAGEESFYRLQLWYAASTFSSHLLRRAEDSMTSIDIRQK